MIEINPHIGYKTPMSNSPSTVQINIPPGFIDLGVGDPQLELLPLDLIRKAANQRLGQKDASLLQYGAEQGDGRFRRVLAEFLGRGYGFPVNPDHLFVTAGISSGLDLLCTLLAQPGDTIFVEEPTYFLALRIFADHGLRLVPIPMDDSGLVVEAVEEALKTFHPKFLYLVPTYQNPSGRTLSQERREALLRLSNQYGFLLLADEVYHFLSYGAPPPKSYAASTQFENVVSLGSFSKILAPGLRLGWIQAHPAVIRRLTGCGLLDSGGGMNPFTSGIVRGLIEAGELEGNIQKLVDAYGPRVQTMDKGLKRYLPAAQYIPPQGGYFFWVRLPGLDTGELQQKSQAFQVGFRPGVRFSSRSGLNDYMRLGISFYDAEQIEQGLQRLGKCLDHF